MTIFPKVAYLANARSLDIRGIIGTEMLSLKTDYAAYLVFKLARKYYGLESANSIVRFMDGWMEVELGYFNSKKGSDGPVEARLIEMKHPIDKGGLFVGGIEFHPK
ncbi:hypothetical protein P3S68_031902 [Capsicum galapagoense]